MNTTKQLQELRKITTPDKLMKF